MHTFDYAQLPKLSLTFFSHNIFSTNCYRPLEGEISKIVLENFNRFFFYLDISHSQRSAHNNNVITYYYVTNFFLQIPVLQDVIKFNLPITSQTQDI